ncbi:MAG: hypothetical protein FD180_5193, partial [Planctomycetota bacterium]
AALDARRWEDAAAEFQAALDLAPDIAGAREGLAKARKGKFVAGLRRSLDQGNWNGALSLLEEYGKEWRDDEDVRALEKLARGTGTLEVDASAPMEVDILVTDAACTWDEETIPPIAEARAAGLARPFRGEPVAPGECTVVWSRDGRVERVCTVEIPRGGEARADFRVRRVGEAYADAPAALRGAPPGTVVELADGLQEAGWSLPPGVLLRPAPGARPVLSAPEGSPALIVEPGCGASVRDLEFNRGTESAIFASGARRFTAARLFIHDFDQGGISLSGGADSILRDCRIARALEQSVRLSGERQLVLQCDISDAGWVGIALEGPDCAVERCRLRGGQRIGIHALRQPGVAIRANDVAGFPDWGILVFESPGALVVDNVCADNASSSQRDDAANIACIGTSGVSSSAEIRHNSTCGGGPGIIARASSAPAADNIAAFHAGPGIRFLHDRCDLLDYNLVWKCRPFGEFLDKSAASLEEFKLLQPQLNLGQMGRGIEADPQFVDAARRDLRLADGSPARRAASDGGDVGARLEWLATLPQDSAGWLRRRAGLKWLERGREELGAGRKPEALALLKWAALLLPGETELPELIRRAGE